MPTLTSFIKSQFIRLVLVLCSTALVAQDPILRGQREEEQVVLPNGKTLRESAHLADHAANLKDLERIRKLSSAVTEALEKGKGNVLPLQSIRDLEEVEKLSKRIRDRLRRY